MKLKSPLLKTASALVAISFCAVSGQTANQSASAAGAAGGSPKPEEIPVEMTPFTVTADQDVGYQAANTLAGSRMSTSLKDTAASISILTEEFIKDIGATNLEEAIAFGNNVELDHTNLNNDNGTVEFFRTFRIRGQAASIGRNYFRWKLPTETFNVERIEEARGPNSILFGIASAGGLISSSTKQASTNRSFRRAQLVYGSYDLRRATVDLNQTSFNGRLGVRLNALYSDTHGYQHFVFDEDMRAHLAVKYDLTRTTVVRAEYERGETLRNTPLSQEVGDQVLKWIGAGRPLVTTPVANAANGIALQNTSGNWSVTYIENDGVFRDTRATAITQGNILPGNTSSGLIQNSPLVDNLNFKINTAGPGQIQGTTFSTYSAFIQHKLGKHIFLEGAYNHQDSEFDAWQSFRISGLQGDPNRFLRDGVTPNPHAGQLFFENEWAHRLRNEKFDNFRLTASTEFDFGQWGTYRLAGLAERELSFAEKRNPTSVWASASGFSGAFGGIVNSNNTVKNRHYIVEGNFGTYFGSLANDGRRGFFKGVANPLVPGQTISARGAQQGTGDFSDPTEQDSYLGAVQAFFFKRRLVLAGGYRTDTLYLHEGRRGVVDPVTGDFTVDNVNYPRTNRTIEGRTKTYGAVFHVLPWLSLRYNQADSLELANTGVRLLPLPDASGHYIGSRVGDNPQGVGQDYGVDVNLLDGRIFVRATKFETTRVGAQNFRYGGTVDNPAVLSNRVMDRLEQTGLVSAAERNEHRIDAGGSTFDTASTGYEISVTTNVTRNWRLQANYSITDSISANIAPEVQAWAAVEIPYFKKFNQSLLVSTGDTIAQEIARWELANEVNRSVAGLAEIGNRRAKFSVVTRYAFANGVLKGFSAGGTARHQSKNAVAATLANAVIYGNSFTRADAFFGYRFAQVPRLRFLRNLSVQLNVYNILNQHDPLILNVSNPNAAVLDFNRLRPQDPRYWRLSADFAF